MPLFPLYLQPGTVKAKLYKGTLTIDLATQQYRDDIDSEASTGTNVDVKTVTVTDTYSYPYYTIDFDNLEWTNITSTDIRYVVFYEDTGDASTDRLIGYHDLGAQAPTTATATINFNENGFFKAGFE